MFERFTERARQVIVKAQQEARDAHADRITTAALTLGLFREGEGLAGRVLDAVGVTEEDYRGLARRKTENPERLADGVEPNGSPHGQVPFTVAAKKTLEDALRVGIQLAR